MSESSISVVTSGHAVAGGEERRIFMPALHRFPAELRDLMSVLPVVDINDELLAALAELPASPASGVAAGLFASDPFLNRPQMAKALRRAGFTCVTNFPTVQFYEAGTAAAFDSVGYDFELELSALSEFAGAGFDVMVHVMTQAAARRALGQGFRSLAYHPGLARSRDCESLQRIMAAASDANATVHIHERTTAHSAE